MAWAAPIAGAVAGSLISRSGGGGSTTTQSADPWEGVQPALRELYGAGLANFQSDGPQYYPDSTIAPQGPTTQQAQNNIFQIATQPNQILGGAQQQAASTLRGDYFGANPSTQGLYDFAGQDFLGSNPAMADLYQSAGRDPMQSGAMQNMFGLASQNFANTGGMQDLRANASRDPMQSGAMRDLYGSTQQNFFGSTPGMSGMYDTANGAMLNSNPYLDEMFNRASSAVGRQFANNVQPGIASMFSGAGRFGSNQMAEGLDQAQEQYGQTLNDFATQIYGGNYAQERQNQQAAQGQLGQFGLASTGQRQAALGQLGQIDLAGNAQRQSALTNFNQLGLSGIGQQLNALGQMGQLDLAGNAQRQTALSQLGQLGIAGRTLQQSALSDLGQQFGRERVMQQGAMGSAAGLSQADYFDAGQLSNLGTAQDLYSQGLLSSDVARFDYGQNAPNEELEFLRTLLGGAPIGRTTSTSLAGNPLMGALGGFQLGQSLLGGSTPATSGFTAGTGFGTGINPASGEFFGSLEF